MRAAGRRSRRQDGARTNPLAGPQAEERGRSGWIGGSGPAMIMTAQLAASGAGGPPPPGRQA